MSQPQPPYGPPPGYGSPPGWGPAPVAGAPLPWSGATETEPKAIVALVLAVLTWTPIVPFVGAIAALVLGRYATRDILTSGGRKTGLGLVRAARILSIVHLVLVAVALVAAVVLFGVLALSGSR